MSKRSVPFLTMRELQKISASAIEGLDRATPIKSGSRVVGMIIPLRQAIASEVEEVRAEAGRLAAARSAEEAGRLELAFRLVEGGQADDLAAAMAMVAEFRETDAQIEALQQAWGFEREHRAPRSAAGPPRRKRKAG